MRQVSVRVTHNRDIVPSWPPMWVGFHHAATEVWVVDVGVAEVITYWVPPDVSLGDLNVGNNHFAYNL